MSKVDKEFKINKLAGWNFQIHRRMFPTQEKESLVKRRIVSSLFLITYRKILYTPTRRPIGRSTGVVGLYKLHCCTK